VLQDSPYSFSTAISAEALNVKVLVAALHIRDNGEPGIRRQGLDIEVPRFRQILPKGRQDLISLHQHLMHLIVVLDTEASYDRKPVRAE
jgi:hypothetical protein